MKKMDEYRKELMNRVALTVILMAVAALLVVIGSVLLKDNPRMDRDMADVVMGFLTGFELICCIKLGMLWKPIKNDAELKKMYIKEYDEREKEIRSRSGIRVISVISLMIFIAAMFAGFFSKTVFITLAAVAVLQDMIAMLINVYWRRKI